MSDIVAATFSTSVRSICWSVRSKEEDHHQLGVTSGLIPSRRWVSDGLNGPTDHGLMESTVEVLGMAQSHPGWVPVS